MKLLIRWAITSLALFVAAWLVPGIVVDSNGWGVYVVMALILGLVNAFVRPLLKFLTCPLVLLTLGVFVLVINALTLWLSSWIAQELFKVDFYVNGFWAAFFGGLIVSIITVVMSGLIRDDDEDDSED